MGWAGYDRLSVDVAYYQGDYWPDGNVYGVIVNVARGNQGSYQETTWGAKQVANARNAGKAVGFYFFNGNLNAYTCGTLFAATCRKLGFDPATDIIAIDCEDEGDTGTHAWGPGECTDFVDGFYAVMGGSFGWNNVLIYMNYTVNRRFDWSNPVRFGAKLWYARPGHSVDQIYWPVTTMKQDGLYGGVDADGHNLTYNEMIGATTPPKKKGKNGMTTLYYSSVPNPVPDDYKAVGAVPGYIWALAGDGMGRAAFHETQDPTVANGWAGQISISQNSIWLTWESYQTYKKDYLEGAAAANVNVEIDSAALSSAVKEAVSDLSFDLSGTLKESK